MIKKDIFKGLYSLKDSTIVKIIHIHMHIYTYIVIKLYFIFISIK
jgi:hypothetical protein